MALSVAHHPQADLAQWQWYGLSAALALKATISKLAEELGLEVQEVGIKWPNDVLIAGGKVAGILSTVTKLAKGFAFESVKRAESRVLTENQMVIVVGIGVNLSGAMDSADPDLKNAITVGSLHPVLESYLSRESGKKAFTKALLANMANNFAVVDAGSNLLNDLKQAYYVNCLTIGSEVVVSQQNQEYRAKAVGVNSLGELEVILPNGEKTTLTAGDVHIVKAQTLNREKN